MGGWMKSLAVLLAVLQARPCIDCAVFLCWSQDGSFCLDAGPDHCTSCAPTDHDESHAACCASHHDDERPVPVMESSTLPCDCLHIQVSQQRPTVVASRWQNVANSAPFVWTAGEIATAHSPGLMGHWAVGHSPPGSAPFQQLPLAFTHLQC